ncbi:hypothetical protein HMPREF0653_01681, partial [Prevotella disiens JCM 6334 = ATCC 29426]
SQTKRANERSEIRTRSWREIALFIRTISLSQTKRANNSAKNNNSFLKKHANKKAM